ncbi:MAG: UTP--glucose-1-phosphate uridylyltransferase GalU [Candidatus Dormibacteraceae bacterium]
MRKAVFPAAGLGTRFLPVTKAQPKEMLPLVDKPTIQYGVEEARASGIEEVIMVTGSSKRAIVDHFDRNIELELYLSERGKDELLEVLSRLDKLSDDVDITYIQQKRPLGLGHAVWTARRMVGDEACGVLLADDVLIGDPPILKQLIDVHLLEGATVLAARRVAPEELSRYGVIATGASAGRVHQVTDLVEKPALGEAPSDLAILGRYVLANDVFIALDSAVPGAGGEIQLTDAIRRTIAGGNVVAVEFEGDYYDTGEILGYLKANISLALRRDDLRGKLLPFLKGLVSG